MWEELGEGGVIPRDDFQALFVLRPFVEPLDHVFARLEKLEVVSSLASEPVSRPVAPWLGERGE
jgi:hypothetical protein